VKQQMCRAPSLYSVQCCEVLCNTVRQQCTQSCGPRHAAAPVIN
jgi:hypothetical protein